MKEFVVRLDGEAADVVARLRRDGVQSGGRTFSLARHLWAHNMTEAHLITRLNQGYSESEAFYMRRGRPVYCPEFVRREVAAELGLGS